MRKSDPFSVCLPLISCGLGLIYPALYSLSSLRFPVISEHSLLYYTLWIMVLYPLPYCTQVAYKKRQRANKRREMETLMRDNLLNILTVPGKKIDQSIFKFFSLYLYFIRDWHRRYRNSVQFRPIYPMQTKLQLTVKLNLQVEVTLVGKQSHLWTNKTANLGIGEVKKRKDCGSWELWRLHSHRARNMARCYMNEVHHVRIIFWGTWLLCPQSSPAM